MLRVSKWEEVAGLNGTPPGFTMREVLSDPFGNVGASNRLSEELLFEADG
ncbi:MAG: hypothetical protein CM15mP45_06140 [Deltaproteobacteria bacterium]|nr:MAG: hypothetical protein CM15mP45_06140 [Deltaproteobacteria bacterium]